MRIGVVCNIWKSHSSVWARLIRSLRYYGRGTWTRDMSNDTSVSCSTQLRRPIYPNSILKGKWPVFHTCSSLLQPKLAESSFHRTVIAVDELYQKLWSPLQRAKCTMLKLAVFKVFSTRSWSNQSPTTRPCLSIYPQFFLFYLRSCHYTGCSKRRFTKKVTCLRVL